jgi:predicted MFS family arabinose efflux permease
MSIQISPARRKLCLAAIMLTNIAVMADLVIIPIISNLYRAFPESEGYVNYIISGPRLIVVLASWSTPFLTRRLGKKPVIIGGGLVFAVGALFGAVNPDPFFMCARRTLVGVGQGIVNVVAVSLIADLYDDEGQRAKLTGFYNSFLSLAAILFSYFAGAIAQAGQWQDAFKCYYVAIPMVIMLILFIPNVKPGQGSAEGARAAAQKGPREPLGWRYWWMSFCWFLINILFGASVLYFISPYIVQNNLGDSEFTGIATSVKSVLGFLITMVFGAIYAALRRNTNTVCLFIAAICMTLMILYPSKFAAVGLASIAGCAYKVSFSYAYVRGFSIVPASRRDDAVAITTAVYGVGSFGSTYFGTWTMKMLGTDQVTPMFVVPVIIIVLLALAEIATSVKERRDFPAAAAA